MEEQEELDELDRLFIAGPTKHHCNLVSGIIDMWMSKQMCDFTLHVQDVSFPCHSVVVSCASPVLKAMILSGMRESTQRSVTFDTVDPGVMESILEYMYAGGVWCKESQLADILMMADFLQMEKLKTACSDLLLQTINECNCLSYFQVVEWLNLDEFINDIRKKLGLYHKHIFRSEKFLQMELEESKKLLKNIQIAGITGDDLLDGIMLWIMEDPDVRGSHLEVLTSLIPITECSTDVLQPLLESQPFINNPRASELVLDALSVKLPAEELDDRSQERLVVLGGEEDGSMPNHVGWFVEDGDFKEFVRIPDDFDVVGESICKMPGGFMLSGGGKDRIYCKSFKLSTSKWVHHANMRKGKAFHGSVYTKGRIFVVSGVVVNAVDRDLHDPSVDVLDCAADRWHSAPALHKAVLGSQVESLDDTVYVLDVVHCVLYSLRDGDENWICEGSMPEASSGCSMTSANGRLYVAGGSCQQAAMFTTKTRVWSTLRGPSLPSSSGALVCSESKLYLLAGAECQPDLQEVEEYDPRTDRWRLCNWTLPITLAYHHAFLLHWPE